MKTKLTSRFILTAVILLAMMTALIYQLGTLTIAEGAALAEEAEDRAVREIQVKGKRGKIMDRNGIVLAYSETSYNVEFLRDADKRSDYDAALYTEALIKAIEIIEAGGGTTIDTSYFKLNENSEVIFDFGVESESSIKPRYKNFCEAMSFYIDDDLTKPQSEWDMSKWPTAEYCYNRLRALWYIPEDMSFEDANKVISIRQEVNLNNYRAFEPVTIAYDVSLDVVAEINMHADELPGLSTSESTTRVYPRGETAAHIVGYLSRSVGTVTASYLESLGYTEEDYRNAFAYNNDGTIMTDENGDTLFSMIKMGYSYSDYVGISGIESTMEAYLTGATLEHQGNRTVEVNKNGSIIREISSTSASNGGDVMLTLDLPLQMVTENALKTLVEKIAADEDELISADKNGKYEKATKGNKDKIATAATGAIVILDVNSGDPLAMASYPSYDPNWFIAGLSETQYEQLFGSDEAAATTPTRNKAISARYAPGSIFKMVTALAGATEGVVGLDETIYDYGTYRMESPSSPNGYTTEGMPNCWKKYGHGSETFIEAIKDSCNYYFSEVAYRLGIERLSAWSESLGLTVKTNVELTGESTGIIGGQSVLYDNTVSVENQKTSLPTLIKRRIKEKLVEYLNRRSMEVDPDAVDRCSLRLMELQDGSLDGKGPLIRQILSEELGLPELITSANSSWINQITSYLNEIQWKPSLTVRSGFGQGTTLVTPLAIARYVAAIANGGTVYDVHIIDKVIDESGATIMQTEPSIHSGIETTDAIWGAIKEGMREVVSPEDEGTAAGKFSKEFTEKYLHLLAGKTGTAQIGASSIDIENTSWFVAFTPLDKPEIAIAICVPNGYSGAWSLSAIEEILTYYYENQSKAADENLVEINGIAP